MVTAICYSTLNVFYLRWFHFYALVLNVEGNLLLGNSYSNTINATGTPPQWAFRGKRKDIQKEERCAQICRAKLSQLGGGKPLWTRLSDFRFQTQIFSLAKTNTTWFATDFLSAQSSKGFPGIAVLWTFRKQWKFFNVSSPVEKTPHFAGNNSKLPEVPISLSRFIWNYPSE